MPVTNPLSSRGPVGSGAEAENKQKGTDDGLESVPRTVAGVVNKRGEIVDKAGHVIGSVADVKDHETLVGGAVTEKGDVVSDLGEGLASVHIDDNYTPTQVPEKKDGGGWNVLGKAKTAMQYGDSIRNAVSYGQSMQSTYDKLSGGPKADAEKTAGEGQIPTPVQMEDEDSSAREDVGAGAGAGAEELKSQVDRERGEADKSAAEDRNTAESAVGEAGKDAQDQADTKELKSQVGRKRGEADKSAAEDKSTAESTVGEAGKDALSAQSPRPISEADTKEIPESLKETTEETAAGQGVPEEGIAGDDKLEDDAADLGLGEGPVGGHKLQVTKPDEDALGQTKNEVEGSKLSKDDLGDDKLDKTNPDKDTLSQTKNAATGNVEENQLGKDDPGDDKLDKPNPDKDTLGQVKDEATGTAQEDQPMEDTLDKETVGEAGDEASGNVEGSQLSKDDVGDDKLDKTKPENTLGQVKDEATGTAQEDQPMEDTLDKETVGEAGGEASGNVEGSQLSKDDLGQDTLGEAQDRTTDNIDEGQLGADKLDKSTPLDDARDEATDKAEEGAEEAATALDFTMLKGTKVNKAGNLVNDKGDVMGRLVDGDAKKLIGKTADEQGQVWNESGKVVGKAEPIADADRAAAAKDFAPFENFPDATVEGDGRVVSGGRQVGEVVEGDAKRIKGSRVDEDGDILDRRGNVVGRAEPWDEPEQVADEAVDMSSLAGKRVNKAGNVVDAHGHIFGRVVEGSVKALVGRMCDKEGNIMSESGDRIGRAELVPESEREGSRDGPFADLVGCTVGKDGKVVTSSGEVVGRLTSGDGKALYGRPVDDDGDVVDKNGNVLGKAERWEEPAVEKKKDPLAGRRVNREGNVVDEDGNIIGKLVSGDVHVCSGKEVDDDGDVVNAKGNTIGHVSLVEDIPPEPEESAQDREKREQADRDRKLAGQLAASIEQSLDKIKPILRMITDKVDKAERTPKEELDEEQLVREVKPLIEEGSGILTETNGVVRGMDPDGRIQRQAKHKASTKDATPEEHHLAEVLKELTGHVTQTIDNAKRKIDGMPHAKKELNPLWGLLSEPLFQIIAAVGLLLNGVLSLVGRLLSGLGLGGLVDNLLGTLGLNRVLDGLGLGSVTSALTGKKDKK